MEDKKLMKMTKVNLIDYFKDKLNSINKTVLSIKDNEIKDLKAINKLNDIVKGRYNRNMKEKFLINSRLIEENKYISWELIREREKVDRLKKKVKKLKK